MFDCISLSKSLDMGFLAYVPGNYPLQFLMLQSTQGGSSPVYFSMEKGSELIVATMSLPHLAL